MSTREKTKKDRIVFFASGEFPVATLRFLFFNDYNIVGIVTSHYKNQFKDKQTTNIVDIAREHHIDYLIPDDINSEDSIAWLKEKDADVFCVISYKKLSNEVLSIPKKVAFNVHGSILPYFRGAAPINHAIRCGVEKTGLTAFILSDKIDCGKILENRLREINKTDTFETLFWKLSEDCMYLTMKVLNQIEDDCEFYLSCAVEQETVNNNSKAPKITEDYGKNWMELTATDVVNLSRSVYPIDGIHISICSFRDNGQLLKEYKGKIYKVSEVKDINDDKKFITDGKNYLYIQVADNHYVSVEEIQLAGKKRMNIQTFLCGYSKILCDKEHSVIIADF